MTTLTDLTPRQVLAVADAALEVAETAGVAVSSVNIFLPRPAVTFVTEDGEAQHLAAALGVPRDRAQVYSKDAAVTIEVFEGDWRGVKLTIQHCIPTEVAA